VDIAALLERCPDNEAWAAFQSMLAMNAYVVAMDKAWQSCAEPGSGENDGNSVEESKSTTTVSNSKVLAPYGGAKKIVYVLQRSHTMWPDWHDCKYSKYMFAATIAINEVLAMGDDMRISAIVYDNYPVEMSPSLLPATRENKEKFANFLKTHAPRELTLGRLNYNRWYANLDKALQTAFYAPGVEAVVLLGDMARDDGAATYSYPWSKRIGDWPVYDHGPSPAEDLVPVYSKIIPNPKKAEEGTRIAYLMARRTKGAWDHVQSGCPKIMGDTLMVSGSGTFNANGEWMWVGTHKGKPWYKRVVLDEDDMGHEGFDTFEIYWDKSGTIPKWILTQSFFVEWVRTTLYENDQDSDLVPTDGWRGVGGFLPMPHIEEYLEGNM
jgi:hypothetical protein